MTQKVLVWLTIMSCSKLMNTSQIMNQWQESFGRPSGGQLGIIVAILDIGAVSSFWMV